MSPRVPRIKPGAALCAVQHDPMLSFLLGYVDGKRDSEALAQELALEVETIERMLGELSRHGVIELASVDVEPDVRVQPVAARAPNARAPSAPHGSAAAAPAHTPSRAQSLPRTDATRARLSMLPPPDSSPGPALPDLNVGPAPLSAARTTAPPEQCEPSPSQPPTTVHRGKSRLSRTPSADMAAAAQAARVAAASAERPSRPPSADQRAAADAARVAAASSARTSHPPAVDLVGAADTTRITVGRSVRASRASSANLAAAADTARGARGSARPARSPSADMRAAAEAARVAAASSSRPSQAPPSGRAGPSQPPAAMSSGSGRAGATSTRPTARPAASQAPLGAAAQILAQAEAAYQAGQSAEAIRHLKLLHAMTFDDVRVQKRADELKQQVLRVAAVDLEKQAANEERHQQWERAAKSWLQVAEGRPTDGFPLQRAALAQLQAGVELRTVMETARRAVQLAPNDAQAHRTLAKIYAAADMQASAAREIEAAKRCGPSSEPTEDASPTGLLKRWLGRDGTD